jgi:cytochrome c553
MKFSLLTILLTMSFLGGAHAEPFAKGDAEAGKKFFAQNQCNSCHDQIMNGDGNAIFTRFNRKVRNPEQLLAQLERCTRGGGIAMSDKDGQNLAAYLNRTYYHFSK